MYQEVQMLKMNFSTSAITDEISNHWFLSIFSVGLCILIASAVKDLYFSPLSNYPGPFFSKISGIPSFYHAIKGSRHVWIWQNHQIYGDTFRFCPNGIIVNSPSGHRSIYGTKSNAKKGKFYEIFPNNPESLNTLNTVDPMKHEQKRRILNNVFSEKALRSAETFIIHHIDRWCQILIGDQTTGDWTEPMDISKSIDYLVFDILGDLCFGRSFESKEPEENPLKIIPHSIAMFMRFIYPITKSPFLNLWVWLKPRGLNNILDRMKSPTQSKFNDFVVRSVSERTQQEKMLEQKRSKGEDSRKDMFHYLFAAKDPETGGPAYTPISLFSEATLLIIAGTDTTSVAMCALFFYITHNIRVYEKLTKEIRNAFISLDEVKGGQKLSSCQYLRACIDEALRMAPPAPSELPREVLPGGLHVDGNFIPAGTQIGTSGWSLMHHDEIFGDPWVYRPERWIIDEANGVSAEDVARSRSAFYPFSIGTGNCAGQKLAMQEMLLVVARTLLLMDVRAMPGDALGAGAPELGWGRRNKDHFQIEDFYIGLRTGPMVQFRRRVI